MIVLLSGSLLLILAYALHVIVWNIRVPQRQAVGLLLCFLAVGAAGGVGLFALVAGGTLALSPLRLALTGLFYGSASAIYFLLFSAIEADSPTLTLIGIIRRAGARGVTREQLGEGLAAQSFVQPRLDQMVADRMLLEVGGRLVVGPRGRLLGSVILSYRRLLGVRQAGG
jgi:hypothetical protein